MILHSYRHKGTVAFPEEVTIDFDALPTVIALHGPNGAGKTTTLDLIVAAFYLSMPYRPGPLHKEFATRGFIDLTWSAAPGGEIYRSRINVDPEAERTEAVLTLAAGGPALAGPLQKNYLDYLRRERLVSPLDLFMSTAYTVQPSYTSGKNTFTFLLADRAERRSILAELLGLKTYAMREAGAKDKIKGLETQLTAARALIKQFETELAKRPAVEARQTAAQGRHDGASEELAGLQKALQVKQEALTEARGALAALAPIRQQKDVLEAESGALLRRLEGVRKARTEAQETVKAAEKVQGAIAERETLLAESIAAGAAAARAGTLAGQITELELELAAAADELRSAEGLLEQEDAILEAATRHAELTTTRVALEQRLQETMSEDSAAVSAYKDWLLVRSALHAKCVDRERIERQVATLDAVPCKGQDAFAACRFLLDAAMARNQLPDVLEQVAELEARVGPERSEPALRAPAVRAELEGVLTAQQAVAGLATQAPSLEATRVRVDALRDRNTRLQVGLDDLRRDHAVVAGQAEKAREIAEKLDGLRPQVELALRLGAARAIVGETSAQATQVEADWKAKVKALDVARAQLADVERLDTAVRAGDRELFQITEKIRAAQTILSAVDRELGVLQGQLAALDELATRLANGRVITAQLETDLEDWTLIARGCGPTGIQALLVDRALPSVSASATDMLRDVLTQTSLAIEMATQRQSADGKKMLEDLEITVRRNGEVVPVEKLSGGEGVLASEALSLSIGLYNAERPGGTRPFTLFRDEVGANLDVDAAPAYTRLLARAAKVGGFRQVLFVTHHQRGLELADARLEIRNGRISVS